MSENCCYEKVALVTGNADSSPYVGGNTRDRKVGQVAGGVDPSLAEFSRRHIGAAT